MGDIIVYRHTYRFKRAGMAESARASRTKARARRCRPALALAFVQYSPQLPCCLRSRRPRRRRPRCTPQEDPPPPRRAVSSPCRRRSLPRASLLAISPMSAARASAARADADAGRCTAAPRLRSTLMTASTRRCSCAASVAPERGPAPRSTARC
jgi:hypothetical protein